jgi:hypothetical protein
MKNSGVMPKLFFLSLLSFFCKAVSQGNSAQSFAPVERSQTRKQTGWYFSDHLGAKRQSKDLDLLYRFYTSQGKSAGPSLEPYLYTGVGTFSGSRQSEGGTSFHFGGRIFFNNFISGLLGLPTLNVVPGFLFHQRQLNLKNGIEKLKMWGPQIRLFGTSHQDSQLRLGCVRTQILEGQYSQMRWRCQADAEMYISPWLALQGGGFFPEKRYGPENFATSKSYFESWNIGGFLEFGPVRLNYTYSDERFAETQSGPRSKVIGHNLALGLAY